MDQTLNVRRQENASLLPPPSALRFREEMFFNAVVREGQGYRYMLDIESILAGAGINLGGSMQTEVADQSLQGAKVLIVEDSRLFQRLAKDSLEKRGAHVSLAENGEQGLAMLLDETAAYDLVISDIEMPIMNGIEMVRRYKKSVAKPAPVFFHSSISNEATSKDIVDEGLGEYLLKFEEGHIIHTACRMIREGRGKKAA